MSMSVISFRQGDMLVTQPSATWPAVMTMSPVASSRLSATMAPLQKYCSWLWRMSWSDR